MRSKIEAGKHQLQFLTDDDNSDPICWRENLLLLMNEECSKLTYDARADIALKLSICHLKQSGIDMDLECVSNQECIQKIAMNEIAFSTYNQFFTHIDNICIFVVMSENDKNMKKSIYNLYTATIDTSDYLIEINEKQHKFQKDILLKQNEIKKANKELMELHSEHKLNLINLQSTSLNIQIKQEKISNQQKEFESKQNDLYKSTENINIKQENILKNQNKLEKNVENINEKSTEIQSNIHSNIQLQKQSLQNQHDIINMQDTFREEINKNNEEINYLFDESSKKQKLIITQQNSAIDTILDINSRTSELREETNSMQNELTSMYEQQKIELISARQQIEELTKQSQSAYDQIIGIAEHILFVVQGIYKLDINILNKIISVESFFFYLFWVILTWFVTTPKIVARSRIILCLIIISCNCAERYIISLMNTIWNIPQSTEFTIMLRQIMFAGSVAIWCAYLLTYIDPEKEKIKLLQEINKKVNKNLRINCNPPRQKRISLRAVLDSITPSALRSINIGGFDFIKKSDN